MGVGRIRPLGIQGARPSHGNTLSATKTRPKGDRGFSSGHVKKKTRSKATGDVILLWFTEPYVPKVVPFSMSSM